MIDATFAIDLRLFGYTVALLFLFGIVYNELMNKLGENKEGYVSFLVALGCLITLIFATEFIGLANTAIVLALFAASGIPMMAGDVVRYIKRRSNAKQSSKTEIKERGYGDDYRNED